MKVIVRADHPIFARPDKVFDMANPKKDNEINEFVAELEHLGFENIEIEEIP